MHSIKLKYLIIACLIVCLAAMVSYYIFSLDNRVKFNQKVINADNEDFNVKYFVGEADCFVIEPVYYDTPYSDFKNWRDKDGNVLYGTNASFFSYNNRTDSGSMSALHIYENENMDYYGNYNSDKCVLLEGNSNLIEYGMPDTALDIMYYTGEGVLLRSKTPYWYKNAEQNFHIENMVWGIGGYDLMLDKSFSDGESYINTVINSYPVTEKIHNAMISMKTSRTAIGLDKDNKIVLAAVFGGDLNSPAANGPTMYQIHLIMKELNCEFGLCLDGSNCTRVSYKENGVNKTIDADRKTFCRIRLTDEAAKNVIWPK